MAIEKDISGLLGKTENEGSTDAGRLTAKEWNSLIEAVQEVQTKVEGTMKGIKYNGGAEEGGQTFKDIDSQGYLIMNVADSSGYSLKLYVDAPPTYVTRGGECIVKLRVDSKTMDGDVWVPATAACTANFYLNDVLVYTGTLYDQATTTPNAVKELSFDLSKATATSLITGEIENEIRIEVNNRYGVIKSEYCYVKVIEMSLVVDVFNTKNVFTELDPPQLIVTVNGTDAYVTATVDDVEILTKRAVSNGAQTNCGTDIFSNSNSHGIHTLKVWSTVSKETADGEIVISTEPQSFTYIYGSTLATPIVMSDISNTAPEEYSNFNISYIAYKYSSTSTVQTDVVKVSLCEAVYDADGNVSAGVEYVSTEQDITFDAATNSGSGSAMLSLFPVTIDGVQTSLVGKRVVKLSIGDFVQLTEIEVVKSSVTLNQLSGYAVYLSSNNRSNKEPSSTVNVWESTGIDKDGTSLKTAVAFDDNIEFIDTGSGWIADSDGNMAMHLRKGRHFTLNYQPFADNPTYNDLTNNGTGRGKTISIEFATRNCLDQNSTVISCLDSSNGSERGFEITASKATLKSNNFELYANFKEDTRIKIDFVIEGKQTKYDYDTVSGTDGTVYVGSSNEALALIYVDGVYQGIKVIPSSTTFLQGNSNVNASFIRFGSDDCDLDVYNIRIYDQALTPAQIVNNYSYDTPKFEDKLAIAKRNDIFDATSVGNKPNINPEKLRLARPDLPFFYVKINTDLHEEVLPQDKKNWKGMSLTEWKNPANMDDPLSDISWTIDSGVLRNQGTSSMSYPWPWRNWDWKTKDDGIKQGSNGGKYQFADGSNGKYWNQYSGMATTGGIKKITLKKDYASSEMCNNAITSEFFTDMAVGLAGSYPNVLSPAMREGGSNTPYRLTFVATPCFMFQQFNDATQSGSAGKGYDALGMMNLIPNKNECDYLGFVSPYDWETCRAQSWELADNMDDWFWYTKLDGVKRNADNTYSNDLDGVYEARYPKDTTVFMDDAGEYDGDFGMVSPDTITAEQELAVRDEQADIIEFHNWLVDVNRQIPEDYKAEHGDYRELSGDEQAQDWNKNPDGSYNKYDTPDYRLNKFAAEAPTRLIVDQFLLYYIWREQFWAFDSGFKNVQVYTMGKANSDAAYMQWGCMVRDADTTLGIENTGKDIFPSHLEDIDYYTSDTENGVQFVYGGAKGLFHNKSISERGGHAVLNGQLGSLWVNLRDTYGSRIKDIYKALVNNSKNTNWNSTLAIKRFRDHQEKWCESLYNFGMRQYFGGEPFTKWIESGLGDKKNSRASWLDRGFYYRNSKYKNLSDYAAMRGVCYYTPDLAEGHTANQPMNWKVYMPMYLGLGAHEQNMESCKLFPRITDINNTFEVVPGDNGLDFGNTEGDDTVTWFYGTNQITELGDLARCCKIKAWQYINFPKLRELNLGHEKDRDGVEYMEYVSKVTIGEGENNNTTEITKEVRPFTNQYLDAIDCSSLTQLQVLDITNHSAISSLNLTKCDQLQKLYARGTNALTVIELPATTSLNTLYLGNNLRTINLTDLTGIEKFELEGASKIERLYIRNCGSYMAARSYDVAMMALPNLESVYDEKTNNNICILTGIDWTISKSNGYSDIERLLNINATLTGKISIKGLPNELKIKLIDKYGDIDDPNNSLYITYTQTAIQSVSLPTKIYLFEAGEYDMKERLIINPSSSNTYTGSKWTLSSNKYATISENGVITRNDAEGDDSTYATLTATVSQMPESDGTPREDIVVECVVWFYERIALPGDYVFNDGTYSDELDGSKSVVGVCFYVDPSDATKRLMCATSALYVSSEKANWDWGLGTGGRYSDDSAYYGSPTGINIEGTTYNCYDISALSNFTLAGPVQDNTIESYFIDDVYRDPQTDGFKSFAKSTFYGDIGWKDALSAIKIDKVNTADGATSITIDKSSRIPSGYYNTLAIIQHRNKILDEYQDTESDVFIRPYETTDYNELYWLNELMNVADYSDIEERSSDGGVSITYGSHLYYPAASACFAYEPEVSNLANKFKKYNWFLPASGDLARILYYCYQSYKDGSAMELPVNSKYDSSYKEPANAFYRAIKEKKLSLKYIYESITSTRALWSSTESTSTDAVSITSGTGAWTVGSKGGRSYVIPVCAF